MLPNILRPVIASWIWLYPTGRAGLRNFDKLLRLAKFVVRRRNLGENNCVNRQGPLLYDLVTALEREGFSEESMTGEVLSSL